MSGKNYRRTKLQQKQDASVGPCPRCGKRTHFWYNDVPLRAFCWGTEEKEHREWSKVIPRPFNPYLSGYDPSAEVK